jgi:hypothetical protein
MTSLKMIRRRVMPLALASCVTAFLSCASADKGSSGVMTGGNGPTTCNDGAVCTTNDPGACAKGHTVCTGGTATCMPDVTTQSCYGADPDTQNKGVCHAGTQSCVGTLGPCMGAVLPATGENCFNELDDDCDGTVNQGCPSSIGLGTSDPLVARGGSGGSVESSMCPAGSLVTAVQVTLSAINVSPGYVISVEPSCAIPTLQKNASDYAIVLTSTTSPSPMLGTDAARTGSSWITCAQPGSVANGTQGSVENDGRTVIESVGANCATLALTLDSNNKLQMVMTPDTIDSGTASVQINGTVWTDSCGADEVLIGFQGRTGAQMDQIQGVCAPLSVTYL